MKSETLPLLLVQAEWWCRLRLNENNISRIKTVRKNSSKFGCMWIGSCVMSKRVCQVFPNPADMLSSRSLNGIHRLCPCCVWLSVSLSVKLAVCQTGCLSVCLSNWLSVWPAGMRLCPWPQRQRADRTLTCPSRPEARGWRWVPGTSASTDTLTDVCLLPFCFLYEICLSVCDTLVGQASHSFYLHSFYLLHWCLVWVCSEWNSTST